MGANNAIIVTGGDAHYYPLVIELISSIHLACPKNAPVIGVIDAGFTEEQKAKLTSLDRCLVRTFLPQNNRLKRTLERRPSLAVNVAKLWLDEIFPEFEDILFLDGDTWIQNWRAIELLLGASESGALAIVPVEGRYRDQTVDLRWWLWRFPQLRSFNFKSANHAKLPHRIRREVGVKIGLNAGVYALKKSAVHWNIMRYWQDIILRKGKPFTSDGLAMALACHVDHCPLQPMEAYCNYVSKWLFDPENCRLVDYFYPHEPVGIVHLANQQAIRSSRDARIEVPGTDGNIHSINLRFGALQEALS